MDSSCRDKNRAWKRVFFLTALLASVFLFYFIWGAEFVSLDNLKVHWRTVEGFVEAHPFLAPLAFLAIYILYAGLLIPGSFVLSIIAGALFPQPWCSFYAIMGATLAALFTFGFARSVFGDVIQRIARPILLKVEKDFQQNAWSYLLFLRITHVLPYSATNLACAFFEVPFWRFLWTTVVGIIPGTYIFTMAGVELDRALQSSEKFSFMTLLNTKLEIAAALMGVLILLPVIIKKLRHKALKCGSDTF